MKKILLVNFSFTLGGTELLMLELAKLLSKELFSVRVLIINDYYDPHLLSQLAEANINYTLINRKPKEKGVANIEHVFNIARILRREQFDVLHCHTLWVTLWIFLATLLSKSPRRIVLTVHSVGIIEKKISHMLLSFLSKKIVAVSARVLSDIEKVSRTKGVVIYNGITVAKYSRKPLSFGKQIMLGNMARINVKQKGQDLLIRAVAELSKLGYDVKCTLIGEDLSNGTETRALLELARLLGVEDRLTFKGKELDVDRALDCVDVFILPSRLEGFGLSLIEAMAKGIPVIASDLDGPREIITHGENGLLFRPGDVKELCDCIFVLIDDSEFARKIAEKGRMRAQEFDIARMVRQYESLYLEVAEAAPRLLSSIL